MVCLLRGQELVSHQIQSDLLPRGKADDKTINPKRQVFILNNISWYLLPLFVEEDETSLKFAMIKFEGQFACGYLSSEKYKYHLIRQSPFNAKEL